MSTATVRNTRPRRGLVWGFAAAVIVGLVYLMASAKTGPVDPTEVTHHQSRATIVFNAGMIVFREGLEAVLIFAAVTASFRGAHAAKRRPVTLGALGAFGAAVVTWFVAQAVLDAASSLGPRLEAITGFLAIVVLMLVLNWFVHKVYWSEWIGRHHRRRRTLLARAGFGATLGLVALGFTSVYREGFEVVLFLQNLQLQDGTGTVLEGVGFGLVATAIVGVITFKLHARLPYKRMLVLTGVLVGAVLVVMIGGTALSFVDLGWLPRHPTPFSIPTWLGAWFEIYPVWETLAAQAFAAIFVIGSYYLAQYVNSRGRATASTPAAPAPARRAPNPARDPQLQPR
jgi:high-affinity iron transporter